MLEHLYNCLKRQEDKIISWYKSKVKTLEETNIPLPIFSSFDVRDSGYKASIVDSNVFPSGFNNLDLDSRQFAATKFLKYLSSISPNRNILIIPENHTRNVYYFEHIKVLSQILNSAGFNTNIGYIEEENNSPPFAAFENTVEAIKFEKIFRCNGRACTESFNDGIIILNNDLSVAPPKILEILENISQPVLPSISLGWYNRKKSNHFQFFNKLITELALLTSFDPWLLGTHYTSVDNINFKEKDSLKVVADAVDLVTNRISLKYEEYNIHDDPFVFVKNNSGTYGLGIVSVSSGEEIKNLNSKNRKKMIYGKGRSRINSVLIQEGIYTKYVEHNIPAEPVIYNIGGEAVGGFMRVNTLQTRNKNLNTRGMVFKKIVENKQTQPIILKNRKFSLYSLLTSIADLAIAYEHKQNLVN
ncbi:hypothetical protein LCGC14_0877210 [marine sediment metagenome]|uniref:Glutamate--cysteine ligase n=1 Tax=marine sediment metagenome TaxID=412755 RepID=A0A0F9RML6_9ZZZZ